MKRFLNIVSPALIQSRLLRLAGVFLFVYSIILTLAPAVRERSWAVEYRWNHWFGFALWVITCTWIHLSLRHKVPDADPYIFPIAAFLTGWGGLTIFRLIPNYGFRQSLWLLFSGLIFIIGLHFSPGLQVLRRYKYVWLSCGLLLTTFTIIFGTDPGGGNERAWLGCCGIFIQPSEPLKLLLIIYLAAYFADRFPYNLRTLQLLTPTAVIMGIALLLLVVQHDLGTAFIFIFLYSIILFVSTGKYKILLFSMFGLVISGFIGYFYSDLIRLRIVAWLNPWSDPSGRSFQIVQSLMAVANGGIFGTGPGLGSPGLVPVAISDFIFTAIAEETGLIGTLGFFVLIGFLTFRGIRVALRAPDTFRRILAAGLSGFLGLQSILIMGGNIRLFPLTGVTLPFVSYGGSSLVTSFLALLILTIISNQVEEEPAPISKPPPYLFVAGSIGIGLLALAAINSWWSVWRGPAILSRTDNTRRSIADRYVQRGSLLDRHETPITLTDGRSGSYIREYLYKELASIVGYTNVTYGQSGLEASLDTYLRGLSGNPFGKIWWDRMLYDQPPAGLNVRLSLDLNLQSHADEMLGDHKGAVVLINAASGEILAMSSHPTFDPTLLDSQPSLLLQDPNSPMLDRAAQGTYIPGEALEPFYNAAGYNFWPSQEIAETWYSALGFYSSPELNLPVAAPSKPGSILRITPLQMVLASAAISGKGVRPAPRLAMAVNTPTLGWVVLSGLGTSVQIFPPDSVAKTAKELMVVGLPIWQWNISVTEVNQTYSWSLGGTLPDWQGAPLAVVVLLEENNPLEAGFIGETLLENALNP